jgi:hypothetical protein
MGISGYGDTCTCCTLAPAASAGECRCQGIRKLWDIRYEANLGVGFRSGGG